MISVLTQKPAMKRQQKTVLKQIGSLREQMEESIELAPGDGRLFRVMP